MRAMEIKKGYQTIFSAVSVLLILVVVGVIAELNYSVQLTNSGKIIQPKSQISEFRGVLLKYLNTYSHNDTLICETLANYGFNALMLEVSPWGWTGDMLKNIPSLANACKQYGLKLYVLFCFYGGGYYPEYYKDMYPLLTDGNDSWRMVDNQGNFVNWNCLQKNDSRKRVKAVIDTLMSNYGDDIAGIIFDYIRMPSSSEGIDERSVCYCDECKEAFLEWLSTVGKTFTGNWSDYYYGGSHWLDYAEWRTNPINNMVRDVRAWALAWNPNIKFGAAVWSPYRPQWGWTPDGYIEGIAQYTSYWVSQGWLDFLCPMEYTSDMTSLQFAMNQTLQYWTGGNATTGTKGAIPLVPFITYGQYGTGVSPVSISFWVSEINHLRAIGCNGFIIWGYSGPGMNWGVDAIPYLEAIKNNCTKGAFQVFTQTAPTISGSEITWITSAPTTGKVEYNTTPLFIAVPKMGSKLPYVDIDYAGGTIIAESTPTTIHHITVPIQPPFYFRVLNNDTNIELASWTCLSSG